jgi:hypothetical protein
MPARPRKLQEDRAQKLEVIVELKLAKIGNLADLPQKLDVLARPAASRDLGVIRQAHERPRVVGVGDQFQTRVGWPERQGSGQACKGLKVEIAVAPEHLRLHRRIWEEAFAFDLAKPRRRCTWNTEEKRATKCGAEPPLVKLQLDKSQLDKSLLREELRDVATIKRRLFLKSKPKASVANVTVVDLETLLGT